MRRLCSLFVLATGLWINAVVLVHAQSCITQPEGLAHWWRGEGNPFDTIAVQDGILIGGVQFTAGKVGTAFLFSGSGDDYMALPQNLFPVPSVGEGSTPFSFEVWFQTASGGVILGQQDQLPFDTTLGGYVPALYVGTNGLLYAQMFWANTKQLVSSRVVNDGQFHHVVVTYDGAVETLYLDGAAIGSTPLVQEGYASVYFYQFATGYTDGWDGAPSGWFPFAGIIDEPSLYSLALSSAEVTALFSAGSAGKCAPPGEGLVLRHRYSFEGIPGSVVVKDSLRGADGMLVYGTSGFPYTNGTPDSSSFSGNGTLDLAGTSGCVLLPPRLLSVLPSFTVEAWVTWQGPSTSAWQRVFDFGFSDRGTNANGIGTNYVIFTPARGGTEQLAFEETTVDPFGTLVDPLALVLAGASPLAIGQEVYIAICYDPAGSSSRLYLNGALVASASSAVNATSEFTDYSDWLGRSQWGRDPYFNGSYNEFRIWEGILNEQDIASHYAAGPDQQFVTIRPALNITRSGNSIILSWPSTGTGELQSTPTLVPAAWVAATNNVTLSNGHYQAVLPVNAASAFYRLKTR